MCGIVGYIGQKDAVEIIYQGLKRLEYRGYDSAGMAVLHDGAIEIRRKMGKIANLEKELEIPITLVSVGPDRIQTIIR